MNIKNWKSKDSVLIIAEIGNNHEGDINTAKRLIECAKESGVDAVKFQTFKTEYYVSSKDQSRFDMIKSFELSYKDFRDLRDYAINLGLIFISTPLDIESGKFIGEIADAVKIASSDNNFTNLFNVSLHSNKPLIVSTGLASLKQISKTNRRIEELMGNSFMKDNFALLHCVTSYPVNPKYANLRAITSLRENFDCTIGYSDHTLGLDAVISAVALGARIIEKHFTLDNNFSDFRDHQISADPAQMKTLVSTIRNVELLLGDGIKKIEEPENSVLKLVRRSVVANDFLKKDHIITTNDLTWIREPGGFSPGEEGKLIGRKLRFNKEKFDLITEKDLK